MTRRFLAVTLAAALASCGSSSDDATFLEGFSPAEQGVLAVPVTDCTESLGYNVTGLLFGFSSFANLCGFVEDTALCGDVASSTIVSISVLRARLASPDPAPIGPGTYPISLTGVPVDEGGGNLLVALAGITKVDAACNEPAATPDVTAGSLVLTAVSPTEVSGTIDVTLGDGSRFQRTFTVPVCAYVPFVCSLFDESCVDPVCCPTSTTCPGVM